MGFKEATSYLDGLGIDAMKRLHPSLHRIEAICEALNHPERSVPAIHITGTNGKTSTARIVSAVLAATGLSVGTYTSPHLQSVTERITLNGQPIPDSVFSDTFDHLWPYVEFVEEKLSEKLTYFEILTAMFFLWAAETPVDVAVVEVGMGGRWDATNLVPSTVVAITNIDLDHTQNLGTDRATIAREKAGIIKPESRVVTAERSPSTLGVIKEEADSVGAVVSRIDRDFSLIDNEVALGGRYLSISTSGGDYEGLYLPLHGSHQGVNAATAVEAAVNFLPAGSVDDEVVAEGLLHARVPGRLETIKRGDDFFSSLVLDVAHNPGGASALVSGLLEAFAFDRVKFVFGVLGDKDYPGMLAEMARLPCSAIATRADNERSTPPEDIKKAAEDLGIECQIENGVPEAVTRAGTTRRSGELVCVTGSHYVVGEARTFLLGQ